ncbi:ResB-like family protein [Limihaloglobus sulfuriphilus]|uniref:ResB-like family protein n=1 Tax=Limihaloglobus sulfuriphilus TaxID=1851148 RepID=A0A1Q2MCI9_9BACT|nr:cytochrome c biogenesis protein ResB [Limihaloglobus sulfuriphilus]AQQ70423.1 ResB-like family protein [Limihaloglobus sulfuriphilus]
MKNIRRKTMNLTIVFIVLWTVWSIVGAFMGADKAAGLFSSVPMMVFWAAMILSLVFGIFCFKSLRKQKTLFLIHIGCILILTGFAMSSVLGTFVLNKLLKQDKFNQGFMVIYEGQKTNSVILPDESSRKLDFTVNLNDFRVEHYKDDYLIVEYAGREVKTLSILPGAFVEMQDGTKIMAARKFSNFKLEETETGMQPYDSQQDGINPAVEVKVEPPEAKSYKKYIFAKFPEQRPDENGLRMAYRKEIREYVSEVEITGADGEVFTKDIKVNKPLHYGGYHIYQNSYDSAGHRYTVLKVVSDSGSLVINTGFALLLAGLFARSYLRKKGGKNDLKD